MNCGKGAGTATGAPTAAGWRHGARDGQGSQGNAALGRHRQRQRTHIFDVDNLICGGRQGGRGLAGRQGRGGRHRAGNAGGRDGESLARLPVAARKEAAPAPASASRRSQPVQAGDPSGALEQYASFKHDARHVQAPHQGKSRSRVPRAPGRPASDPTSASGRPLWPAGQKESSNGVLCLGKGRLLLGLDVKVGCGRASGQMITGHGTTRCVFCDFTALL